MIGERLTNLRKEKMWTQEEVSKRLNIPRSTYSNYEAGNREPDFETTELFAEFFEVSVDYLLGRTDDKKAVLAEQSSKLIDMLDLSDEEIINKMDFVVDGIKLEPEDIKIFLALVRSERLRKKQNLVSEQNKP